MFNIDQVIVIITLMLKSIIGQGWTSFKETCTFQVNMDDYEILSRDAESGLHCVIISEFSSCQTCLFVLSAKTCACIYQTDNATTSNLPPSNELKTILSNGVDTAKFYVINNSPPTSICKNSNYNWIPELQTCLRMITDRMTYTTAKLKCSKDGAHILMLKTRLKTLSMYKYLVCNGYRSVYWLGIGDQQTEGVYRWIDGSKALYVDWFPGDPTAVGGEDCVRFEYRAELEQYSWFDIYCGWQYSVICEE